MKCYGCGLELGASDILRYLSSVFQVVFAHIFLHSVGNLLGHGGRLRLAAREPRAVPHHRRRGLLHGLQGRRRVGQLVGQIQVGSSWALGAVPLHKSKHQIHFPPLRTNVAMSPLSSDFCSPDF